LIGIKTAFPIYSSVLKMVASTTKRILEPWRNDSLGKGQLTPSDSKNFSITRNPVFPKCGVEEVDLETVELYGLLVSGGFKTCGLPSGGNREKLIGCVL
jgi:hypothetical protein